MTDFLRWTAWPMTPPSLYGPFHLLFFLAGTILAILIAYTLAKWLRIQASSFDTYFKRTLWITGLLLIIGELYKQLLIYLVITPGQYSWWLFPFQLCSLPMYLCILLPVIHHPKRHRILCTFLLDFNTMGAIAAFIDPSGIFQHYWTLTLHGILWHLILIFIGFFILFCGQADLSPHGFTDTLPLFACFCVIAEVLNVLLHPFGPINLFYLSPWEMSTQLLFSDIDKILGRPAGIFLYILAMIAGARLIHWVSGLVSRHMQKDCL